MPAGSFSGSCARVFLANQRAVQSGGGCRAPVVRTGLYPRRARTRSGVPDFVYPTGCIGFRASGGVCPLKMTLASHTLSWRRMLYTLSPHDVVLLSRS